MWEPLILNLVRHINVDRFFFFFFFLAGWTILLILLLAVAHLIILDKIQKKLRFRFLRFKGSLHIYTQIYSIYTLPYCLVDRYLPLIDVEGWLKNTLWTMSPKASPKINSHACVKKHRCQCSDRLRAVDACRRSEITSRAKALHTTRDSGDTFIVFIKR